MATRHDFSVIICTRDRAPSLDLTLAGLEAADRAGLDVDIIVVDNGSADNTRAVVEAWKDRLSVRYVREDTVGMGPAMNAGIAQPDLGELVVKLDDDMTVDRDWFQGMKAATGRWPDVDVFCGRIVVAWPDGTPPPLFEHPSLSWIFSALDCRDREVPVFTRELPITSGNYWIRRDVFERGFQYEHKWLADPNILVRLAEAGYQGMAVPDAVMRHRVQDHLLDRDGVWARAMRVGRNMPLELLLSPRINRKAELLRDHPLLFRLVCVAGMARWVFAYVTAGRRKSEDAVFGRRIVAFQNWTGLRHARSIRQRQRLVARDPVSRTDHL